MVAGEDVLAVILIAHDGEQHELIEANEIGVVGSRLESMLGLASRAFSHSSPNPFPGAALIVGYAVRAV
jgi:hypothetical protein